MLKPVTTLAAALAMMLPADAFAAPQVNLAPTGPVVELNIYETVQAAPDRVTIGAGVTTSAPTATEALRQNAADMTEVIARIKALGIAEGDIQTTGVGLGTQSDYVDGKSVFRGYQASNRVSVVVRKIEETGRMLDALVEAGATDVSGPDFGITDDTSAKAAARKAAIARGEAQAKAYAAMLGFADVRVLAVSESIAGGFPLLLDAKAASAPAVAPTYSPIQPGQVSTGINVTITYELVGKKLDGTK